MCVSYKDSVFVFDFHYFLGFKTCVHHSGLISGRLQRVHEVVSKTRQKGRQRPSRRVANGRARAFSGSRAAPNKSSLNVRGFGARPIFLIDSTVRYASSIRPVHTQA